MVFKELKKESDVGMLLTGKQSTETTTGSITLHDVVTSDDQDPDMAAYAQVDYAKKRESRRHREQNKTQHNTDPSDKDYSWV